MIHGAKYISDFIDSIEETTLLQAVDGGPWRHDLKRRVQHFGYRYDYRARTVDPSDYLGPLPKWVSEICHRLVLDGYFQAKPDQVIVNEYLPGQGIAPHIDCVPCFGDVIASLSLGSGCEMVFENIENHEKQFFYLEPCSLLVLSEDARFKWRHSIPTRKSDVIGGQRVLRDRRVSLTFRSVLI